MAIAFLGFNGPKMISFIYCYGDNFHSNCIIVFGIVTVPSKRLQEILKIHKLVPKIVIECSDKAVKTGIKTTLIKNAGIYMCINLINGNYYVGSASKGYIYDRYQAHLQKKNNAR